MLQVRTKTGIEDYRVEEVIEIPGPLGVLLFNANYPTTTRLEEVHLEVALMMSRIQGDEDQDLVATTEIPTILENICEVPHDHPVTWINPISGLACHCSPQHAIEFVRWESDRSGKPLEIRVGSQFCQDPTLNEEPVSRYIRTEGLPKVMDYLPSTRPVTPPQQSPEGYHRGEEMKEADDHEETYTQPSEGDHAYDLDDDAISETSNLIDDMIRQRPKNAIHNSLSLRDQLGIKSSDTDGSTKNKLAFYPSSHDKNMFRALFARKFHGLPAMAWCENMLVNIRVKFLPTPSKIKSIFRGKHGIGGVTGADFLPMHKRAQKEWFTANPSVAYNFGADAKVVAPHSIHNFLELKLCYDNQVKFFRDFGSPTAINHFDHVYDFMASLDEIDAHTPAEVAALAEWLDSINQLFMTTLGYDLQSGEMTHLEISKRLVKSDPELIEMKREVITLHYHELVDRNLSTKRKATTETEVKEVGKKKKLKTEARPVVANKPSDGPVLSLLPLHNGKQICLRHLSKEGCYSKHPLNCSSNLRTHFVPEGPLPAQVQKHLNMKWGGVSDQFPQLAS